MPTRSRAQQRMMLAIAHGAKPKGGKGPTRAVAKEFVAADHARGAAKLPERIAGAITSGRSKHEV
jgi:hypothetical protein